MKRLLGISLVVGVLAISPSVHAGNSLLDECRIAYDAMLGGTASHTEETHLNPFYRSLNEIDPETIHEAAKFRAGVKVIADPQKGFLAKVMMIRNAKRTIDVSTYIFHADEVGYMLLDELKKAVERGVSVRVLVDSEGSLHPTQAALKSLLSTKPGHVLGPDGKPTQELAKVEVKLFNPMFSVSSMARNFRYKMESLFLGKHVKEAEHAGVWRNRRMHDKFLGADLDSPEDAVAIIGGRNLDGNYYGLPERTPKTYNDMEIIFRNSPGATENPVGDRVTRQYNRNYYHIGNKILSEVVFGDNNPRLEKHVQNMAKATKTLLKPGGEVEQKLAAMEKENFLTEGFGDGNNRFLNEAENIGRHHAFLNPETGKNHGIKQNMASILRVARAEIAMAKESIDVVSPYLDFTDDEVKFLHAWLKKDPKRRIRIVTNSVATGDNMPAQAMIDTRVAPQFMTGPEFADVRDQVTFYQFGKKDAKEYGGNEFYGKIHAKFLVIDKKHTLITSFNGDPRSRYLNSEIGLMTDNEQAAKDATAEVERFVSKSYVWGSPEWEQLRNHPKNRTKMIQERIMIRLLPILMPTI